MSRKNLCICVCVLSAIFADGRAMAAESSAFACGGKVESQVWAAWDSQFKAMLNDKLLTDRLLKQGDSYALYDFQADASNVVSMARRCKRTARLKEIATMAHRAYGALVPFDSRDEGRAWVCRGGNICNGTNHLLNKEVVLDSLQFLGLTTAIANALSSSGDPLDKDEKAFVSETFEIATEHMLRWGDEAAISAVELNVLASPDDVRNGQSALFFTDRQLWQIAVYAEMAGVLQAAHGNGIDALALSDDQKSRMRRNLVALLRLFNARLSFQRSTDRQSGASVSMAALRPRSSLAEK